MSLRINDIAPDFTATTTEGTLNFHDWIGDGWAMLFSHPKDFTPVCATELGSVANLKDQFEARNCKVIGLSVDKVDDHLKWAEDIADISGTPLNFPIIADENLDVAKLYDMLPGDEGDTSTGRTAVDNQTVRVVFLVGPDKKIKMNLAYPMSTGRNFEELLRVIDSCQLTAAYKVATPANWQRGEDVIIVPALNNDAAQELFPDGWETIKPYLRKVKDPTS
ncbi:peroxiredoxin [SAR202 cluster bacterium AD-802-E10_MRT_200m]|nr:peroxiredoxin [SAR202 cluster bacterium AD-802-E10_MRT_200m]